MNWKTFGHEGVKRVLELQVNSGRLAHAYLLYGPEGIGKKMLALDFAEKVLQVSGSSVLAHPDFSLLDQTEEISIEQMRQFIESLSFKPFVGVKKVAIINNAELMNVQSANALLKTLEEPSDSTIIILISSNKHILPTIISRCQVFSLSGCTDQQLRQFATERGLPIHEEMLQVSFGSIARLLRLLDKKELEYVAAQVAGFEALKRGSIGDRLLAVAEYAEQETQDLAQLFTLWLMYQRSQKQSSDVQLRCLGGLSQALLELQTNKNKKLIIQNLFLNFA